MQSKQIIPIFSTIGLIVSACSAPSLATSTPNVPVPTVIMATVAPTVAPAKPTDVPKPTDAPKPTATPIVATSIPATATPEIGKAKLDAIKDYLVKKAGELKVGTTTLKVASDKYYETTKTAKFNYAELWKTNKADLVKQIEDTRKLWTTISPLYEQMEGIVGGTPSLSDFDTNLDAGSSAEEGGDNIVTFDLKLPDGRVLRKPGNLFGVTESTLWGTFAAYTAKNVQADWNNNGKIEFGETLPDANVLKGGVDELDKQAGELLAAAKNWTPTESDAFTSLVVMIPTMTEYFEAWKSSRFIAGDKSNQRDFVAISRLADIQDILGSLQVIQNGLAPLMRSVDIAQEKQIADRLTALKKFVADVYVQEQAGKRYTPEQAETLGKEAQKRADDITGQVTQLAGKLKIKIQQ